MSHKREIVNQKAYNARKENTLDLIRALTEKAKAQRQMPSQGPQNIPMQEQGLPMGQGMFGGEMPLGVASVGTDGIPAAPQEIMPEEDVYEAPPIPRYWLKVAQNKVKDLKLDKNDWRMQALKRFEDRYNELEEIENMISGYPERTKEMKRPVPEQYKEGRIKGPVKA